MNPLDLVKPMLEDGNFIIDITTRFSPPIHLDITEILNSPQVRVIFLKR